MALDETFPTLSIIHISPYYPELNPIEQVWSWMRQNEIANRAFSGYDDIVEKCANAWNHSEVTSIELFHYVQDRGLI